MIIFLVLIFLLIGLFVAFIVLNRYNYYQINPPNSDGGDDSYFTPNPNYFTLKDSWLELSVGAMSLGEPCYSNSTCSSDLCANNQDTSQNICIDPSVTISNTSNTTTGVITLNPDSTANVTQDPIQFKEGEKVTVTLASDTTKTVSGTIGSDNTISLTTTDTNKLYGGFNTPSSNSDLYNYGMPLLYSAICAQSNSTGSTESYYPNFKDKTLVNEDLITPSGQFNNTCENYTFQQSPLSTGSCYDSDQLAGTKIVELCQATINTNQICINNDGDRVYSPELNSLYIKPSLTLCENNTSINYITFNFNNVPQTINVLNNLQEDSLDLYPNQLMCLSADSITYYPDISITSYEKGYYLTFKGTWGFEYSFIYTSQDELIVIDTLTWYDPNYPVGKVPTDTDMTIEMKNRLGIDTDYGIIYKIPGIILQTNGFKITSTGKVYSYDNFVDIIEETDNQITSDLTLQPCAVFDTSYGQNLKTQTLDSYVDKQKFKVSRFTMKDGTMTPDENGVISSFVYRNLNYENGGLYVDYYTRPSAQNKDVPDYLDINNEELVLRKVNPNDTDSSNVWLLMPPMDLSPYTIPSGNDMWCTYTSDVSTDGGNTFNKQNSVIVPMMSNTISEGTEIIDPNYNNLVKQPDNALFSAIGDIVEGAGMEIGIAGTALLPCGEILVGEEMYGLSKDSSSFDFHLIRNDPSFGKCSQICGKVIPNGSTPKVKAVAMNSGTLGSVPPGHTRGLTQKFAEGNVIAGIKLGGQTCKNYYLYDSSSTNPSIASRGVGETYTDGNVDFIIQGTYNDTYMFQTNYFNNKDVIEVSKVSSRGSGYGITDPPKNVINSLSPNNSSPQKFQYSIFTQDVPSSPPGCTLPISSTIVCTIGSTSTSDLCKLDSTTNKSIISTLLSQLNSNTDTVINVGSVAVPVKITFSSLVCNSVLGLESFYNATTARINFTIKSGSANNITDISGQPLNNLFPSVSDTSKTTYTVTDSSKNFLYDDSGKQLELIATYGDFERQYRLYYNTNYVANVGLVADSNGKVTSVNIIEIIDEPTIISNLSQLFTVQEWWILPVTYGELVMNLEYYNTNATGCQINLSDDTSNWDILQPAPKNLYKQDDDPLNFPSTTEPINLSNNSVLKHGPSPQQIVYGGTFQEQTNYCYTTYPQSTTDTSNNQTNIDNCNKDPKCTFNVNLGYCKGKTLIEYGSETLNDPFTLTQNISGSIFNDVKSFQDSIFTDLTYLKSLQLPTLNYMSYNSINNQTVEGGSPTYYYEPPNFINYQNQNISVNDVKGKSPTLGKFIPYQYFYPNSMTTQNEQSDPNQLQIVESSTLQDTVQINKQNTQINKFYVNLNYTQFIPYGKKSLYAEGFTKQSDVPTF